MVSSGNQLHYLTGIFLDILSVYASILVFIFRKNEHINNLMEPNPNLYFNFCLFGGFKKRLSLQIIL